MKNLQLLILCMVSHAAFADFTATTGFDLSRSNTVGTSGYSSVSTAPMSIYIGGGYEQHITYPLFLDVNGKIMNHADGTLTLVDTNLGYQVTDKVSVKAGLNYSYPLAIIDEVADRGRQGGVGGQASVEYKINDHIGIALTEMYSKETFSGIKSFKQPDITINYNSNQYLTLAGIIYRF
jgi:hypothetical protein